MLNINFLPLDRKEKKIKMSRKNINSLNPNYPEFFLTPQCLAITIRFIKNKDYKKKIISIF